VFLHSASCGLVVDSIDAGVVMKGHFFCAAVLAIVLGMLQTLCGCANQGTAVRRSDDNAAVKENPGDSESMFYDFELGVGDTIAIAVYRKKTSEFILGVGDTLTITVFRNDDLSRNVRVDLFGRITMPLIGDIKADGKTVTQVREEIASKLSRYLYNPQVMIDATPLQNWKIDDLSMSVEIGSNGNISFPILGELQASGKTTSALKQELEMRLSEYFSGPLVTISLQSVRSQEVHVLGEVRSPTTIPLTRKLMIWEALTKAGGFTEDANRTNVLLIRKEGGELSMSALNLKYEKMLQSGARYLRRGDILYVPPSMIANIENFMIRLNNIITPIVGIERGIVLQPDVEAVLKGEEIQGDRVVVP